MAVFLNFLSPLCPGTAVSDMANAFYLKRNPDLFKLMKPNIYYICLHGGMKCIQPKMYAPMRPT